MKFYEHGRITILHGHVLRVLAQMPDESVHCVVTSPPYWGLRDYGLEPQIWDEFECVSELTGIKQNCIHVLGNETKLISSGGLNSNTIGSGGGQGTSKGSLFKASQGQFCIRCNAWRGSLGLEPTPELYVQHIVQIFRDVRRVMRADATMWLNLGDSYASGKGTCYNPGGGTGSFEGIKKAKEAGVYPLDRGNKSTLERSGLKPKDLIGIPWRCALALQADGWYLRMDIIWHKPNPMPESCKDRPTKSHEYIFLLSKNQKYFYDAEAIKEPDKGTDHWRSITEGQESLEPSGGLRGPHRGIRVPHGRNGQGRNKRSVWTIPTQPFLDAHFATFPEKLVEPCILAGCPKDGIVLDPFCGSGRTLVVAKRLFRKAIGIDLNEEYLKMPLKELEQEMLPFK